MTITNSQSLEKRTVRKTMIRILPLVIIMNIVAYLDRVNFGYAALDMNTDLALTAEAFGIASGIFFIGYILFEIPSNMVMAKVGAKLWISRIMITWGIVVILMGFSQTASHLYILRFLLGVAEAGFFPGVILYLTFWFRKKDRAIATSVFLISVPLSGIIGGPLSTWIMDNIHWGSLAGWRWMLILEATISFFRMVVSLSLSPL